MEKDKGCNILVSAGMKFRNKKKFRYAIPAFLALDETKS
jgi:hypothetical protein